MKKNKGFTLIELLAIIVILAIIAVITVPIILNIIENSKQGAATDSAYGYKDAVNKWYVSKLQDDNNYTLNGNYTVSDGKLNNIDIPLSGDKPTNGTLTYSNNILTGGCLTIGEYKVTFDSKGSVSKTEKGSCNSNSGEITCSSGEYLYEINQYVVTDEEACETYFENVWECADDESCISDASDICSGKEVGELSLSDNVNLGYIDYSDIQEFVLEQVVGSCRPILPSTDQSCFTYNIENNQATITGYTCSETIKNVVLPNVILQNQKGIPVTKIGDSAFSGIGITSIEIPDSIEYAGFNAVDDVESIIIEGRTITPSVVMEEGHKAPGQLDSNFKVMTIRGTINIFSRNGANLIINASY